MDGASNSIKFVVSTSPIHPHKFLKIRLQTTPSAAFSFLQLILHPVLAGLNVLCLGTGHRVGEILAMVYGFVR